MPSRCYALDHNVFQLHLKATFVKFFPSFLSPRLKLLSFPSPAVESGVSLLQLIGDPPPDAITRSYGPRGETAYVFTPAAVSGQPALAHVPNPFYRHFSLVFHLKPSSPAASVLFSITDGPQRLMYIAVKLSAVQSGRQKVQFFYTEPDSEASYEAASFNVPSMVDNWSRFSLAVFEEQVTFYQGCDSEPQVVKFERSPDPMELDGGAGIFVGQAGGADSDKFQVMPEYQMVCGRVESYIWVSTRHLYGTFIFKIPTSRNFFK